MPFALPILRYKITWKIDSRQLYPQMRQKKAQKTLEDVQKTYNEIAGEFSASRMALRHDFENYAEYFKNGQKIVDLGCGNGRLLMLLKEKINNFDYIGIDNSDELLKEAQKNFPDAKFIHGDQLQIPLHDESCEVLCNIRAFHHIPSKKLQQKALQEMQRVLKPEGLLILTCWNLWNRKQFKFIVKATIKSLLNLGKTSYKDTQIPWGKGKITRYYYAFTYRELRKLIQKSGFKMIESKKLADFIIIAKKRTMERPKILGVLFDNVTKKEALERVLKKIWNESKNQNHSQNFNQNNHQNDSQNNDQDRAGKEALFIATPNPEILLEARKNEPFRKILNQTDLNIADGFGIILASWVNKTPLKERLTGTDFMQIICQHAPKETKIFLLGAAPGIAEKTKKELEKRFANIQVVGTCSGSPALEEENHLRQLINKSGAEILFVAFGAPKQEIWIARNLPHLTNIKIAMGVGGAFDFISGTIKRAPTWMRKLGLEWLYRLIKQPSRIGRIFNATIKFPLVFIGSKLKKSK